MSTGTGLDLIRLVSLYSPLPESIPALLQVIQTTIGSTKELETNSMLAFRAIANFFISIAGKSLVKDESAEVSLTPRFESQRMRTDLSLYVRSLILCRGEVSRELTRMVKLHWLPLF
jgi:hypothetical protein